MGMWVKFQGEHFRTVEEFRAYVGCLPESALYQCAYDIAYGRDIIGTPVDYPENHSYRAEWQRRLARAGVTASDAFDRALEIAEEITLPPANKLTPEDLRHSTW